MAEYTAEYYYDRVKEILNNNMSEKCYKLWQGLNSLLPKIYDKPTSSTGKHHKKLNGEIPSQAEHIFHLIFSAEKLLRMFDVVPKTQEADLLFLAISLHDSLKYGEFGSRKYTEKTHDKLAADMIEGNRETLLKIFDDEKVSILSEMVRFHSGRWSTDIPHNGKFDFRNYHPYTFFIHMLDMMSTNDLIQTDVREAEEKK